MDCCSVCRISLYVTCLSGFYALVSFWSLVLCFSQQLSLLPLMEPLIGVNFAHFAPYGSGQINGDNLLSGTFGSASLDGVSDYYSQLAYKVRPAGFLLLLPINSEPM